MRIQIDQIPENGKLDVPVEGNEAWLEGIYKSFFSKGLKNNKPELKALFEIRPYGEGIIGVKGSYDFQALIPCARCGESTPWSLQSQKIDLCFLPEPSQYPQEHNLSAAELDEYFVHEGCIDLEEILNESIQLNLPGQSRNPDGSREDFCHNCRNSFDDPDEPVYKSHEGEEESPFKKLLSLKLDS